MMLNPTVTLRNFFDTLQKINPLKPKPEGQSYEKKSGARGVEKSKIGRSEGAKWSGDVQ